MDELGIVMIYHGDIPFDYREKETYEGVQIMMGMAKDSGYFKGDYGRPSLHGDPKNRR